jgi:G3E family GTPase
VIDTDEEIFEMNNGCICCTVRGDLIRIISNLMKRRHKFDHLVIETTGLADPAPVIQTFFVDEDMRDKLNLDAVVTVVGLSDVRLVTASHCCLTDSTGFYFLLYFFRCNCCITLAER